MKVRKMLHQMSAYKDKFENIENIHEFNLPTSQKKDFNTQSQGSFAFRPMTSTDAILKVSLQNEGSSSNSCNSIGMGQSQLEVSGNQDSPASFRLTLKKKKTNSSKLSIDHSFDNLQELGIQRKTLSHRLHESREPSLKLKKKSLKPHFLETKALLPEIRINKKVGKRKSPTKKLGGRIHKTLDAHELRHQKIVCEKIHRNNSISPWDLQIQQYDTLW